MSSKTIVLITIALVALALLFGFKFFVRDAWKAFPSGPNLEVTPPAHSEWKEFIPDTNNFKVKLPLLPQHATDSLTDPLTRHNRFYNMYVSQEADGTIYMVSTIQFQDKRDVIDSEGLLKSIVSDMMKANPDNKLIKSQAALYDNMPAQDFVIQNPQVTMEGKTFLDNETLYILTTIENGQNYKPEDFNYFFKSFQLIK